MDDNAIINLYWERSESAISETAKKYGDYLFSIAMNILSSNEDAEECTNSTYLNTWNSIPPGRPPAFRLFLGKITRNLSHNKFKEQRVQKRGGGEISLIYDELEDCIPSNSNVEIESESRIIVEALNSCLRSMDREARIIFVRRYWYAESIIAISSRYSMSESKVKSILFRARGALKSRLEAEGVMI